MDVLTPEQRRKNMQSIRYNKTLIEEVLAKILRQHKIFYRRDNKKIFGKPDFTIRKYRLAIFCDSEFFHGKDWQKLKSKLDTNKDFWIAKIERNIERDKLVNKTLKEQQWNVIRFWGEDIKKNAEQCVIKIKRMIEK
jgi:DNA mismatch endonuclease Vsr